MSGNIAVMSNRSTKAHSESQHAKKLPRPDPRPSRTREAIILAAQRLFGEHRADGVSIDELIAAAGVSKQSFYNYFRDKDVLAHEVLRRLRCKLDQTVGAANEGQTDSARRIATAICVHAFHASADPNEGRLIGTLALSDIAASSDVNVAIAIDVRDGLKQGRLAVFSVETGVAFIIGSTQTLISRILIDGTPELAVVSSRQFATLVLRAFGIPPIEAEIIASEAAGRIFGE